MYHAYLSGERDFTHQVKSITGFLPKEPFLYRLALRHSSLVTTRKSSAKECNERLEFLGDTILDSVVSEYLFKIYPMKDEGFLTEMRAKIVNRQSLNQICKKLRLSELIQFNQTRRGQVNKSMYGDALEAFVGAIYLDRGYKVTKRFILRKILRDLVDLDDVETTIYNFKSMLLEYVQKEKLEPLKYELVKEKGEGNDKYFKVCVRIGGEIMGYGDGKKKKVAEQNASQDALIKLQVIDTSDV